MPSRKGHGSRMGHGTRKGCHYYTTASRGLRVLLGKYWGMLLRWGKWMDSISQEEVTTCYSSGSVFNRIRGHFLLKCTTGSATLLMWQEHLGVLKRANVWPEHVRLQRPYLHIAIYHLGWMA